MVVLVDARQLGFYAVAVSLAELPQTAFMQVPARDRATSIPSRVIERWCA